MMTDAQARAFVERVASTNPYQNDLEQQVREFYRLIDKARKLTAPR